MRCSSYTTANTYPLLALKEVLPDKSQYQTYPDALSTAFKTGTVFVFSYGCIVFWDLTPETEHEFLDILKKVEQNPRPVTMDVFNYQIGEDQFVKNDEITLARDGDLHLQKLAVSYGLSQSSKLGVFEDRVYQTIQGTEHIPKELSERGRISLSRKDIAKKIGDLFLVRNSVNLHTDILDTPEFFWDHPAYEKLYSYTRSDLDVEARTRVLNTRLDIIRELFEVMGDALNNRHSTMLEWVIILLIFLEVSLTIFIHFF